MCYRTSVAVVSNSLLLKGVYVYVLIYILKYSALMPNLDDIALINLNLIQKTSILKLVCLWSW